MELARTRTLPPRGAESAPVVVLLHGFLGSRRDFASLQNTLSRSFETVAIDLPAHGDSAWLRAAAPGWLGAALALSLATEVDRLAPQRQIVIVGYSMGGRLAMQLAADDDALAGRISALITLSASAGIEDTEARATRMARDEKLAERLGGMSALDFARWLRREWYSLPLWGRARPLSSDAAFEPMIRRRVDGARLSALAEVLVALSPGRVRALNDWLRKPPFRLLYVAGDDDEAYAGAARALAAPGEDAAKAEGEDSVLLRTDHPNLSVRLVPQAAHNLLAQAPNTVARLVAQFIEDAPARPTPPTSPTTPPPGLPPPPPRSRAVSAPPPRTAPAAASSAPSPRDKGLVVRGAKILRFRLPLRAPLPGVGLEWREGAEAL